MRRNKLLYILIPIIIILVALLGGFIYLKLNSSPKKIFTRTISKVFETLDLKQEKHTTLKGKVELSGSVESNEKNEDIEEINDILQGSKIVLNSEVDTKNLLMNENLEVVYNNEDFINANIIMQDEKMYIALKDWLDKYIEIPLEDDDVSEIKNFTNNLETLDLDSLVDVIKKEFIKKLQEQKYTKESTNLYLDGKETKVTKSSLKLSDEQTVTFIKELLENLKQNENFKNALGTYKEEIIESIDEILENVPTEDFDEDTKICFSIYTKGLFNKVVAVDFTVETLEKTTAGIEFIKRSEEKYELNIYENDEGIRTEIIKVEIDNKKEDKNKGKMLIYITSGEETIELTYKYEVKNEETIFELSTNIEDTSFTASGNTIKRDNSYNGNFTVLIETSEYGTIEFNCLYNFEYDTKIERADVSNATVLDEMSEEDEQTFITNVQESKAYGFIKELIESDQLFEYAKDARDDTKNQLENSTNEAMNDIVAGLSGMLPESKVTRDEQTVEYKVPNNFEVSIYSEEDYKQYSDEYNEVYVSIEKETVEDYLKQIEDEYVLTSEYYTDQELSGIDTYVVEDKTYQYRSIVYKDSYTTYCNLYFAYELKDGYIYVVEVKTENGNISLEDINEFLKITMK